MYVLYSAKSQPLISLLRLSSRMSTPTLGWSRLGASKMARLREWSYNKESMLELVRWQSKELPMVAGAEDIILLWNIHDG